MSRIALNIKDAIAISIDPCSLGHHLIVVKNANSTVTKCPNSTPQEGININPAILLFYDKKKNIYIYIFLKFLKIYT